MLDRVPVPTDNIYKFIGLFSLVTWIFSLWALFTLQTSTNEQVFKYLPEIEALKVLETRTTEQEAHLAVMQRRLEIAKSDKSTLTYVLLGLFAFSLWFAIYGFRAWHQDIQPLADAQNKAQLELLQLQIAKLKLENQKLAESMEVKDELPKPLSWQAQVAEVILAKR